MQGMARCAKYESRNALEKNHAAALHQCRQSLWQMTTVLSQRAVAA